MSLSKNKTALITGATGGIGGAISVLLAKQGYDLYLLGHTKKEQLTALCHHIRETYAVSCMGIQCDVSDYSQVDNLFQQITDLDVLIHNAGISYLGLLQDMDPCSWHKVLDTNLSSCFYLSKKAIPIFLSKGAGRIIHISSVWGAVGASMEVAYSASKGGMNSFTKALAKELAPSRIQVNAIACGVIDTPMNHCFSKEELEALRQEIPADRFGTSDEVARLVLQLLDAPEYLTGQIITLDGGWC